MGRIGIIAGKGSIVASVAEMLSQRGYEVVIADLSGGGNRGIVSSDRYFQASPGQVGRIVKGLKRLGVSQVVFIGKVEKGEFLKGWIPKVDLTALKLLSGLKDWSDYSLMGAAIDFLEESGIEVLGQREVLSPLMAPEGVLGKRSPSDEEWRDIAYGFAMAKAIGSLGIGQTVVVKRRAVVAVESLEGTDATIRRGGKLAGEGVVVVKVKRPRQVERMDLPGVGLETLKSAIEAKCRVLAFEAHETVLMERQALLERADSQGVSVVGVTASMLKNYDLPRVSFRFPEE